MRVVEIHHAELIESSTNQGAEHAAIVASHRRYRQPAGSTLVGHCMFRLYSVAAQLILWATIGLCFAPLAGRLFGSGRSAPQVAQQGHLCSSAPTEIGWPAAALVVIKRVQPMYAALAALPVDVLRRPRERGFRWRSRAVPSS
jgi:hypothetical protein